MHLYFDPTKTKKQLKKINELKIQDIKKALDQKKSLVELITGKEYATYKLEKLGKLKYILNSQTPPLLVLVDVPNKGRINLKFKKLEDKVSL